MNAARFIDPYKDTKQSDSKPFVVRRGAPNETFIDLVANNPAKSYARRLWLIPILENAIAAL
jgi:hypothetical protein